MTDLYRRYRISDDIVMPKMGIVFNNNDAKIVPNDVENEDENVFLLFPTKVVVLLIK